MPTLRLKPSPRLQTKFTVMLAVWGGLSIIGTLLLTWFIAVDARADAPFALALGVALLGNALWIVPGALLIGPYCRSLSYEIQDDEVIVRVGIITRSIKHVPYRTVTNIAVKRGPFDRLFGLGTLNIQTAGMSGQQGAEEALIGLPNVQDVYDTVAAALRVYRGAMGADAASVELAKLAEGAARAVETTGGDIVEGAAVLQPLPPQEVTVKIDYGELKPLLETILRELRIIRQNIEL
ncbi:MAG: hypothetical protein Kow0077_05370 [Anaerolineae bacterium]